MKKSLIITILLFFIYGCKGSVEDENIIIKQQLPQTNNYQASKVVLYSTLGNHDGAFGPSLQSECESQKIVQGITEGQYIVPFISNSSTSIKSLLPTHLWSIPVISKTGTTIANSWNGLFSGTILVKLSTAGVLPGFALWRSGSNADGSINPNHCNSWTDNSGSFQGRKGSAEATNSDWISHTAMEVCSYTNAVMYYLCMTY